jgi:amidase
MRLLLVFALAPIGHAKTYRFEPKESYNTFSADHKPTLQIKPGDRVITYTRIELPLRPMLGCVVTAPANKAVIPTSYPDNFGGNNNGMGASATLMLPLFEPGALFFLGDGHARQGDGEAAIETSLDVEFSVDLIKGKKINWARLENRDFIMVLGSSRALNEPLQHATTELMRWLMADYGFDERGASLLMGQGMEYDIYNVVDPEFTVVAKMRKQYMRPAAGGR